ncbi:MAG: protoporphyrinogen oxidase [Kofleriaceae bacterium]
MRLCVVGAGVGGLTAARALVAAGHDVRVLEASPRAGGVVGTSRSAGFAREHAASSFIGGPPRGALALCGELGVAVDKAAVAAKRRWIFLDGKLRQLPSDLVSFVRSDLLTWRGKLDLLKEPFVTAKRPTGQDESMYAFAARRLGPQAARAIIGPFVTGIFAADAQDVSLEAGFPRLAALDADGGLVRGLIKQRIRARRGGAGDPRTGPRTERGMYAPVGGLGALVAALATGLGDRLELAGPVRAIEAGSDGVVVDGERFDGCVLALPAQDAVAIVTALPELRERLAVFTRSPVALVYLGVPAVAVPRAVDGFGFLVARGEELRVLGVVFESTVWPDRAPPETVLLRCIFGGGRDPDATALDDATLIAQARRDVARALGGGEVTPVHASVVRWPNGLPRYPVGHRDRVREATAVARRHRIVLAGADYRGPAINDLCADAETVVAEVNAWT